MSPTPRRPRFADLLPRHAGAWTSLRGAIAILALAAGLLAAPVALAVEAPAPTPALWRFIVNLRTAVAQGAPEVEDALPVTTQAVNDDGDYYVMQAGPFDLDRDQRIEFLSFRVPKLRPLTVKTLQLQIDGDCVRLRAVRRHFPDIKLSRMPRGGLIHEQTFYAVTDELGTIGFGFPEHRRYCVQNVVLLPPGRTLPPQ